MIPPDLAARLASGTEQAPLEVIYNGDALEQSLVQLGDRLGARAGATSPSPNRSSGGREGDRRAAEGGNAAGISGCSQLNLIGLGSRSRRRSNGSSPASRPGATRSQLLQINEFAGFASREPAAEQARAVADRPADRGQQQAPARPPHAAEHFAVVVAVSISLMFVGVLLAAGSFALEREEHVLARLVPRPRLARDAAGSRRSCWRRCARSCSRFAMLAGIGAFVALDWIAGGAVAARPWRGAALAFGALGVAIGALAREVRAASLLAFLLSLPLAFLALVPEGSVAGGLTDAIDVISFVFPFKAALQALDCGRQRHLAPAMGLARAPDRADTRVRGDRPRRAAPRARRKALTSSAGWPFHRRACAGCARARACAGWCARPTCGAGQLVLPLFVSSGPTARCPGASRSPRCPGSSGCR